MHINFWLGLSATKIPLKDTKKLHINNMHGFLARLLEKSPSSQLS